MKETLLVYAFLFDSAFIVDSEYREFLDEFFLKDSSDALLLELEWYISDLQISKKIIFDYFRGREIDYSIFGKFLMEKLKKKYILGDMTLENFNLNLVKIWSKLPQEIICKEPFWAMSYAGEPLSWGDAQGTRNLYEKMFNFYCAKSKMEE
ncbi:MAG: hypothetical protein FWC91_06300 [Defluviitaleaceae bacterium]|nr:hypothetical protein [Defluviitaleaceae bacterium]